MRNWIAAWFRSAMEWINHNQLRIGRIFLLLGIGIAIILAITLLDLKTAVFFLIALFCMGIGYEMLIRYLEETRLGMSEYMKMKSKEQEGYNILDALKDDSRNVP